MIFSSYLLFLAVLDSHSQEDFSVIGNCMGASSSVQAHSPYMGLSGNLQFDAEYEAL